MSCLHLSQSSAILTYSRLFTSALFCFHALFVSPLSSSVSMLSLSVLCPLLFPCSLSVLCPLLFPCSLCQSSVLFCFHACSLCQSSVLFCFHALFVSPLSSSVSMLSLSVLCPLLFPCSLCQSSVLFCFHALFVSPLSSSVSMLSLSVSPHSFSVCVLHSLLPLPSFSGVSSF